MHQAGMSLRNWVERKGYALHTSPRESTARARTYWTKSNKHDQVTARDIEFLKSYVATALAFGTNLSACGIEFGGMGFLYLDVAVMNSCLNGSLVELNESTGTFEVTLAGLTRLGILPE